MAPVKAHALPQLYYLTPIDLYGRYGISYAEGEGVDDSSILPIICAFSLGEASAENKGHGPETSRDADGQDR